MQLVPVINNQLKSQPANKRSKIINRYPAIHNAIYHAAEQA